MAVVAAGVYLAFDGGPDASGPDGQGIGPYDEIVLRGARAVGERDGLGKIIALRSAAGSWRDAETSSAETDQVETGLGDLRVNAGREDVVVRFSDDEVAGQGSVPDLGPFTVVVIGTYDVRGDDETLAVRVSRIAPWQLTDRAGARFQGAMKDALIFVAAGRSTASQPRPIGTAAEPRASQPTIAAATSGAGAAKEAAEDDAPSVWIDRVRAAPEIYISRPERKR